jgi:hypothetical protein
MTNRAEHRQRSTTPQIRRLLDARMRLWATTAKSGVFALRRDAANLSLGSCQEYLGQDRVKEGQILGARSPARAASSPANRPEYEDLAGHKEPGGNEGLDRPCAVGRSEKRVMRIVVMQNERIIFELSDRAALGADDLQWILYRATGTKRCRTPMDAWKGVSFVRSTKSILLRCVREKALEVSPTGWAYLSGSARHVCGVEAGTGQVPGRSASG